MPETTKTPRLKTGRLVRKVLRILVALFLIANLYALALKFIPVPTTVVMVQRHLAGEDIRRNWTPLSDISPFMVEAVLGGEDGRFCEHEGIDWDAVKLAYQDNQDGGRRRGGSTITQQTAKNVFFWNGGGLMRKAGEAWFASLIDYVWGKSRVMEVYLNVAEWGDGIFGVEAAAQARFGKPASDLTRREAALLAAVLPSPNKWRLDPPSDFVNGRAGLLQQRMSVIRNSGYASCVTGLAASKTPKTQPAEEVPSPEPQTPTLDEVLDKAADAIKQNDLENKDLQTRDPEF